jgi:hypothetical protein
MSTTKTYPDVHALGKQLSEMWDESFSGQGGPELRLPSQAMITAACFGAEAFDQYRNRNPNHDGAPIAMMQAFLRALADPTDPRLDHLRAKNQPDFNPDDWPAAAKVRVGGAA